MGKKAKSDKILFRVDDLEKEGFTRFQIPSMLRRGELTRLSRGLYYKTGAKVSSRITLAALSKLVPRGIICLLTALRYYGIGTQNPGSTWIALPQGVKTPKVVDIPIIAVRFSSQFQRIGVANIIIDGENVRITSPVRTIIDCFRFRNRIGLDVAIEALEEGAKMKIFTKDRLVAVAKMCRIYAVMKPYMELIYR